MMMMTSEWDNNKTSKLKKSDVSPTFQTYVIDQQPEK